MDLRDIQRCISQDKTNHWVCLFREDVDTDILVFILKYFDFYLLPMTNEISKLC